MAMADIKEIVKVPQGVTVTVQDGTVAVKGKNGELKRAFAHPDLTVEKEGSDLAVSLKGPRRKTRALLGTWLAHLRNMVRGAQENFEYRLKIVYSHFPIKVKVQGDQVLVDNFLGEKTPRRARIMGASKVKLAGEEVVVTGPNVEDVSQTAANIEQACKIRGYDPKVFQDGIYITLKGK